MDDKLEPLKTSVPLETGRRFGWRLIALFAVIAIALGLVRLRFDTEVLNLLPANSPAVAGLKLYQKYFSNARELVITVRAPTAEIAESAARIIATRLRRETNLITSAVWQPPWLEHPEQAAELIAYLWLNEPPQVFG